MSNKFVLVSVDLLKNLKELANGTEYEDEVKKVIDGGTVELFNPRFENATTRKICCKTCSSRMI